MNFGNFLVAPEYTSLASLLLRLILGTFFVLARFRWVYDPSRTPSLMNPLRHKHFRERLCTCGYGTHPLLCGFVASVEIAAGFAVILGLVTMPALCGLLCVLLFATWCTAREKVCAQNPVDQVDCISCYLWRVEGVYITVAVSLLCLGPGTWSLDHLLFGV